MRACLPQSMCCSLELLHYNVSAYGFPQSPHRGEVAAGWGVVQDGVYLPSGAALQEEGLICLPLCLTALQRSWRCRGRCLRRLRASAAWSCGRSCTVCQIPSCRRRCLVSGAVCGWRRRC